MDFFLCSLPRGFTLLSKEIFFLLFTTITQRSMQTVSLPPFRFIQDCEYCEKKWGKNCDSVKRKHKGNGFAKRLWWFELKAGCLILFGLIFTIAKRVADFLIIVFFCGLTFISLHNLPLRLNFNVCVIFFLSSSFYHLLSIHYFYSV